MARQPTVGASAAQTLRESGRLAIAAVCVACAAVAQAAPVTGKLSPELVVNPVGGQTEELAEAPSVVRTQLPETVGAADKVWQGSTFAPDGRQVKLVVWESALRPPILYADLDFDNRFSTSERFQFQPSAEDANAWGDVLLYVALRDQPFQRYPIRLRLPRPGHEPFGSKALLRTPFVYVSGTAEIGGKAVLVWVQYDPKKGGAFADFGWQGIDVNGDGRIQTGANSPEYTFARDEAVVFNVTGIDVSIASVDLVNRTFSLREHPSGSNRRVTLSKGSVVPDFGFRDLGGREHKLSQFRGKYVLLDFWGTWCPPCIKLLPELQSIHQQFHERGLVLLGLPSHEENSQSVRSVLEKHAITFLQAEPDSIRDVVEKRFRINAFPTHVLIDPEGRILDTGESVRPPSLGPKLDILLPRK